MEGWIGPHGSGKSRALEDLAAERTSPGSRTAVLTLPQGRRHWLARLARRHPAVLGLQVMHFQALYTEILAAAGRLREPLDVIGRMYLVGEALKTQKRRLLPGEARLVAYAIAELKHHGIPPKRLAEHADPEVRRLARVYAAYEQALKDHDLQDPDDRRREAIENVPRLVRLPFDRLLVDGFRELSTTEVRFLKAYEAAGGRVVVALPAPHAQIPVRRRFKGAPTRTFVEYANPVEEARSVVLNAKRLIVEEGVSPNDIAIVVPASLAASIRVQARAVELPLMDESRTTLADTPAADTLDKLLRNRYAPDAASLALFPELAPLARAMEERGVSGLEAAHKLADLLGLGDALARVLRALEPASHAGTSAWVRALLQRVAAIHGEEAAAPLEGAGLKAAALTTDPEELGAWWFAFLRAQRLPAPRTGGVLLTTPHGLAGRRFPYAFVAGAYAGGVPPVAGEDYFIPEDDPLRAPFDQAAWGRSLARRLEGRTAALWREASRAGGHTQVSYPRSNAEGLLAPEPLAFEGETPRPADNVYRLTLRAAPYAPPGLEGAQPPRNLRKLEVWKRCAYRGYLDALLPPPSDLAGSGWAEAVFALRENPEDAAALKALGFEAPPPAALWGETLRFRNAELWVPLIFKPDGKLHFRFFTEKPLARVRRDGIPGGKTAVDLLLASGLERGYPAVEVSVYSLLDQKAKTLERVLGTPESVKNARRRKEKAYRVIEEMRQNARPAASSFECRGCRYKALCRIVP